MKEAIELLTQLISIPSFSREENKTADAIQEFFKRNNIPTHRHGNNVWAKNLNFSESSQRCF